MPIDSLDPDAPAGAVVETFGETPNSTVTNVTSDTYLSSETSQLGNNFGGSARLSLEGSQKRALLRFDLSSIAPGKVLVSARLHLAVTAENAGSDVLVSPVTEAWTEGAQAGSSGVANFTQRTVAQAWTTAGAQSPGSAGAQIATVFAPPAGTVAFDLPVATAQGWVDTPSTNFGVVFAVSGGGDVSISASDSTTATERPELVITYFP